MASTAIERLNLVKELALQNGGECLSSEPVAHNVKLKFRCADGHEFNSAANKIKCGRWCPQCRYPTEALVRSFFEEVFKQPFPEMSPLWLRNEQFGKCRLDGYCDQLKLAFEYHGSQHAVHVDFFHKQGRRTTLQAQQARDAHVREACARHGVRLVEIEYIQAYTVDSFIDHIARALCTQGFLVDRSALERFRLLPFRPSQLRIMQALAESRGGKCISTKFVSLQNKLLWRCSKGHEWLAKAANIKNKGYWCPVCSGWTANHQTIADPLLEIRELANANGGKLLSTAYVNNRTPLEFECRAGHTWKAEPWTIKRNHWCPYCMRKKLLNPLDELREIALTKGGVFLGEAYKNNRERQPFKCRQGHNFLLKPINLKHHGMWCPQCK